jgi:FKBP-type peptidyl-prolyl cis-trans isomerase SlyD
MVLKKGDFIRINYTGKIKGTNTVFDTTSEKVAKEKGIFDEKIKFKATPVVIGSGHVIKGVDEALVGMEVGEKKVFEVPPEMAYGKRDPSLVKVIPLKDFKRQGMTPVPGMRFEAEGRIGKVQSVGGGRVRVDFNYELAGKTLEYEVNVEEKVNKREEKIRLLSEIHFPYADHNEHDITIENGKVVIVLSEAARMRREAPVGKHLLVRDILKHFEKINAVEFRELYEREKAKPTKKKTPKKQG